MPEPILCKNCGWEIEWWDEYPPQAEWVHVATEDPHCHIKKAMPPKKFERERSAETPNVTQTLKAESRGEKEHG